MSTRASFVTGHLRLILTPSMTGCMRARSGEFPHLPQMAAIVAFTQSFVTERLAPYAPVELAFTASRASWGLIGRPPMPCR
jgi:hypothetical protein